MERHFNYTLLYHLTTLVILRFFMLSEYVANFRHDCYMATHFIFLGSLKNFYCWFWIIIIFTSVWQWHIVVPLDFSHLYFCTFQFIILQSSPHMKRDKIRSSVYLWDKSTFRHLVLFLKYIKEFYGQMTKFKTRLRRSRGIFLCISVPIYTQVCRSLSL